MALTGKQKTIKYALYCLLLLFGDMLQNTSGLLPEIGGARCFILIPAAVILTVSEEELAAALIGLFAGLLWDTASAVHMGFNCIFFSLLCFCISALVSRFIRDTFITNMLFCAAAILLYCFLYWLIFIVFKGMDGAADTLAEFYIPCGIYTLIITPAVYLIYRPIKRKLNKAKAQAN